MNLPPQIGPVILLGDINLDTVFPVPGFPIPGQDILSDQIHLQTGGSVSNTAVILCHLGMKTILLSCVGEDVWGTHVLAALESIGVDVRLVSRDRQTKTGMIFLFVTPDGERTMLSYRGANVRLDPAHIPVCALQEASLLHLSGYAMLQSPQRDALWRAVELAVNAGVPISMDTELEPVLQQADAMRALLPLLSVCVLGLKEAYALTGLDSPDAALDALLKAGSKWVGLKMGSQGSILANAEKRIAFPAFVVNTLDTTGAGDSFSAGLLYGWLRNWDMLQTGTLASAAGALAATVRGAGLALPDKKNLLAFLNGLQSESLHTVFSDGLPQVIAALKMDSSSEWFCW